MFVQLKNIHFCIFYLFLKKDKYILNTFKCKKKIRKEHIIYAIFLIK